MPRFEPEKPFDVTIQFSTRFDENDDVTLRDRLVALRPPRAASCSVFATLAAVVGGDRRRTSDLRAAGRASDWPLYSAGVGQRAERIGRDRLRDGDRVADERLQRVGTQIAGRDGRVAAVDVELQMLTPRVVDSLDLLDLAVAVVERDVAHAVARAPRRRCAPALFAIPMHDWAMASMS